ncbi:unnamed protein product [Cladocopium goreaui]|uniref:Uncharacterized protein n=1 Tax=Cladocopium goreaui TaxID=2562237 RepID=A0A9P1M402_9DINO|nr:unnamed protein product [Cladocopium goreaui]
MVSLPASEVEPISDQPGGRPPVSPRSGHIYARAISPEENSLSHQIETMYRQRKQALRFLRRCEDEEALQVLQETLDPQPQRFFAAPNIAPAPPVARDVTMLLH